MKGYSVDLSIDTGDTTKICLYPKHYFKTNRQKIISRSDLECTQLLSIQGSVFLERNPTLLYDDKNLKLNNLFNSQ